MTIDSEWLTAKERFPLGEKVNGTVIKIMDFGVFVNIPNCPVHAVLLVTEFEDGDRSFDILDYPQVGQKITAVVVDLAEHNRQLRLSTKASHLASVTVE